MVGRVHWLLWHLPSWFKGMYDIDFDYRYHKYVFTRFENNELVDCFIVIRTSKRCFRTMVYIKGCEEIPEVLYYETYPTSKQCAKALVLHAEISFYNRKVAENAD